ncbi:hypothetical protein N7326_04840 [Corynebacterium sp. ES2794-CONJ1]|uniref:hypothetical protein n=1 Tax=unclassified Corynebacterium TaxID=2624378 RepID=UPI0021676388|nr:MULTISPECIES: hypothetical protein [unclassified Corynebacterium]MCS4489939.1 hypothetical protein [Corynebacterium sp. ES2775-CONJ]MCS4491698.1 hypothetical protein [Corynebacterium sp. ES2715-CONJ3]MCS4531803.1 hypothetical protein [Corynebacterium sp. ES2730-CONJ]MCU9519199.1 hypothetical protein [Corynebacterium sp. ES2794-CONJ1]
MDFSSVIFLAQQGPGPVGSEFGKASPIGWFVLVALVVAVLFIGWAFHRRYSRLNRRRLFAEEHQIDPFDAGALDRAMAEAGLLDQRKKHWF